MGHGIKKETYVGADEKTTKELTFDLLNNLSEEIKSTNEFHVEHIKACGSRFKKIENRKKRNTAISVASGFGGGFTAVAMTWLKKHWGG